LSTPHGFTRWLLQRFAARTEGEPDHANDQSKEIDRRYTNIRAAMEAEKVDALIVCGNQYAGFEGAVRYTSGFEIVHRLRLRPHSSCGRSHAGFPARGSLDR